MNDIYSYFTIWGLLISFSIFLWSVFLVVPKWIFLFACCLLTSTSIMGTFFITFPSVQLKSDFKNISTKQVILEDAFIHSGPLIHFLCLFPVLKKNTNGSKHLGKTLSLLLIVALAYLGHVKFEQIYENYDYFCLIILSLTVFLSRYQIYISLLGLKV